MKRDHLIPQPRTDKNGTTAVRYVRPDSGGSNASAIPAPNAKFSTTPSQAKEPVILEGSLLSREKNKDALLGDFKRNEDGSATISKDDFRMVQKMLNNAVDTDQNAAYEEEYGGNSVYFIGHLMSQGDINALRTIYGKAGANGNTIEQVWTCIRRLRASEVIDKKTNYATDPGFDAAFTAMNELGLNAPDGEGFEYDYIDGLEGESPEKTALFKYIYENPDSASAITQAVIARETVDVEIIKQIVDSGTPALAEGFI